MSFVLSDCTTFATERVMCYLMDLWRRLCLAIGRGRAPRTELSIGCVGNEARACLQVTVVARLLSISCVTNEARACHQCNTYRAPASATSPTKRERACKHPESRACLASAASATKRERACKQHLVALFFTFDARNFEKHQIVDEDDRHYDKA